MWHLDVCASLSRAAYLDRAEEIKEAILNWRIVPEVGVHQYDIAFVLFFSMMDHSPTLPTRIFTAPFKYF